MVIEGGAADVRGVKLGSKVVKINAIDVMSKPYLEVTPPPPPSLFALRSTLSLRCDVMIFWLSD